MLLTYLPRLDSILMFRPNRLKVEFNWPEKFSLSRGESRPRTKNSDNGKAGEMAVSA